MTLCQRTCGTNCTEYGGKYAQKRKRTHSPCSPARSFALSSHRVCPMVQIEHTVMNSPASFSTLEKDFEFSQRELDIDYYCYSAQPVPYRPYGRQDSEFFRV